MRYDFQKELKMKTSPPFSGSLEDCAAVFLEENNISGDTMVEMDHCTEDLPSGRIGSFDLADIMAAFVRQLVKDNQ